MQHYSPLLSLQKQLCLQIPALEAQLLQSLLPRDEADQRDVVLEVGWLIRLSLPFIHAFAAGCMHE